MSAQLTYDYKTPIGAAGGIVDLAPYQIDTYINEENTGVLKFGMGVVTGTAAGSGIALPSSSSSVFEGVATNNRTTEYDLEGVIHVRKGAAVGVMKYGKIYVRLATSVAPTYGAPVTLVYSGTDKGCFGVAATSNSMPINAIYVGGADNGVAPIQLALPVTTAPSQAGDIKLGDLSDVTITEPSADQVLKYTTTGNKWVNGADAT